VTGLVRRVMNKTASPRPVKAAPAMNVADGPMCSQRNPAITLASSKAMPLAKLKPPNPER